MDTQALVTCRRDHDEKTLGRAPQTDLEAESSP